MFIRNSLNIELLHLFSEEVDIFPSFFGNVCICDEQKQDPPSASDKDLQALESLLSCADRLFCSEIPLHANPGRRRGWLESHVHQVDKQEHLISYQDNYRATNPVYSRHDVHDPQ